MLRNLFVFIFLFLSGCILYWDPDDSSESPHSHPETSESGYEVDEIWIENAYVDCEYDYYWDESRWYLDVDIAASYIYFDNEVEVGFYIDDWDYYYMNPVGYGMWTAVLDSYYYQCDGYHVFDFVVSDIYGGSDSVTIWW